MDKELIELLHSMTGDYSEQAWQHEVILKAITALEAAESEIKTLRNYGVTAEERIVELTETIAFTPNADAKLVNENEELQQRIAELEGIMKAHQIRPQGKSWSADMLTLQAEIKRLDAALAGIASRKDCFNDMNGCIAAQAAQKARAGK